MKKWIKWKSLTFQDRLGFIPRQVEVQFHSKKKVMGRLDYIGIEKARFIVGSGESGFVVVCGNHVWNVKGYENIKIRELAENEKREYINACGSSYEIRYQKYLNDEQIKWVDKNYIIPETYNYKQLQKINEETSIVSIDIKCPIKKEIFKIDYDQLDWEHDVQPCELCGSHGYLKVSMKCPCGLIHTITISSD